MSLEGRVVAITGATGGLGKVVTRLFAEQGASLALLSSDQSKLDALATELNLASERTMTFAADLTSADGVQAAAKAVTERFGQIDILLHLVGGWVGGKEIPATDSNDLRSMLDQHVWTTWYLLQSFTAALSESGKGRVIVVSSPVANAPTAKSAPYAAAKAAQEALMLTAAKELKSHGVTANIIQVRTIDVKHERDQNPSSSNANWTTPEEIAAAMVYLCSDEAKQVNGVRLGLYGG